MTVQRNHRRLSMHREALQLHHYLGGRGAVRRTTGPRHARVHVALDVVLLILSLLMAYQANVLLPTIMTGGRRHWLSLTVAL